jgi:hypothetical protein
MYYPKSQITPDLYTNGNEFQTSNGEYVGYYYLTSDGKRYTGRNPNDRPNTLLLPINIEDKNGDAEAGQVGSYNNDDNSNLLPLEYLQSVQPKYSAVPPPLPISITPLPTEENYKIGEFERYFLKRFKSPIYIEVDKDTYLQYRKQEPNVLYLLYYSFNLPWVITGKRNDVYNINLSTVQRKSKNQTLPGFESYFKNQFDQYFRYSPGENLITDGTEFIVEKTRKPYVGSYHIHPDKGPMVGAQHVKTPHDYLIPISGSNTQYKINKAETQKSNTTRSTRYSGGY